MEQRLKAYRDAANAITQATGDATEARRKANAAQREANAAQQQLDQVKEQIAAGQKPPPAAFLPPGAPNPMNRIQPHLGPTFHYLQGLSGVLQEGKGLLPSDTVINDDFERNFRKYQDKYDSVQNRSASPSVVVIPVHPTNGKDDLVRRYNNQLLERDRAGTALKNLQDEHNFNLLALKTKLNDQNKIRQDYNKEVQEHTAGNERQSKTDSILKKDLADFQKDLSHFDDEVAPFNADLARYSQEVKEYNAKPQRMKVERERLQQWASELNAIKARHAGPRAVLRERKNTLNARIADSLRWWDTYKSQKARLDDRGSQLDSEGEQLIRESRDLARTYAASLEQARRLLAEREQACLQLQAEIAKRP